MIKYSLKCSDGHHFESWFQSAAAFDTLQTGGHLSCPTCGDNRIKKALMTPKLGAAKSVSAVMPTDAPGPEIEAAIKRLKSAVEENSDYVGENFAREARAIHLDEAPARPIHGEAKPEEARALAEDGVQILPLPFRPKNTTN